MARHAPSGVPRCAPLGVGLVRRGDHGGGVRLGLVVVMAELAEYEHRNVCAVRDAVAEMIDQDFGETDALIVISGVGMFLAAMCTVGLTPQQSDRFLRLVRNQIRANKEQMVMHLRDMLRRHDLVTGGLGEYVSVARAEDHRRARAAAARRQQRAKVKAKAKGKPKCLP